MELVFLDRCDGSFRRGAYGTAGCSIGAGTNRGRRNGLVGSFHDRSGPTVGCLCNHRQLSYSTWLGGATNIHDIHHWHYFPRCCLLHTRLDSKNTIAAVRLVQSHIDGPSADLFVFVIWCLWHIPALLELLVGLALARNHAVLTVNSIQFVCDVNGLRSAAWYAPMAVGGLILATVSGFTLHLLSGKVALLASGLGYLISVVLFATIPPADPNYWAYVFPAMLGATLGVDVTYGVSNIFITTNLPKRRQGLAGAVINSVLFLGMSFFLGVADMVESSQKANTKPKGTYKAAFWLATGSAIISLVIIAAFVRIGKAKSDLTVDERAI